MIKEEGEEPTHKYKGVWLPSEILDNDELLPLEKMLWSMISSLSNEKEGCFAANFYFAKRLRCTERYVRNMIKSLIDKGLVFLMSFDGRRRFLGVSHGVSHDVSSSQRGTVVPPREEPQFLPERNHSSSYIKEDIKEDIEERYAPTPNLKPDLGLSRRCPASLRFSEEKKSFEGIKDEDLASWKLAYPDVDLSRELAKMTEWLKSNPSKAKKKAWRRFVTTWLSKAQDSIENKKAFASTRNGSVPREPEEPIKFYFPTP